MRQFKEGVARQSSVYCVRITSTTIQSGKKEKNTSRKSSFELSTHSIFSIVSVLVFILTKNSSKFDSPFRCHLVAKFVLCLVISLSACAMCICHENIEIFFNSICSLLDLLIDAKMEFSMEKFTTH